MFVFRYQLRLAMQRMNYTAENLLNALSVVWSGRSVYSVSNKNTGPSTIVSSDEEAEFVRWIMTLSQRSIQQLITHFERETPFKAE